MERGAYFDPNTSIRHPTNNPEFQGYLIKQSTWMKEWRKRYFILKGSKLFFAKDNSISPHGMIDLSTCQTVKSAEQKAGKKYAFEVSTPDTTYLMVAESDKDKDDWIGAIGRAIVKASSTFTSEPNEDDDGDDSDADSDDSSDEDGPGY